MVQKRPFYAQGLRFSCTRCSACCRHESGFVFLSRKDVSALTAALSVDFASFVAGFCRWVPSENGSARLSLKEKANYDCIFWSAETEGCSVYEARPIQCRAFPFWPSIVSSEKNWKSAAQECPGIDRGDIVPFGSIEKWLALRQNEPIISMNVKENVKKEGEF